MKIIVKKRIMGKNRGHLKGFCEKIFHFKRNLTQKFSFLSHEMKWIFSHFYIIVFERRNRILRKDKISIFAYK